MELSMITMPSEQMTIKSTLRLTVLSAESLFTLFAKAK